MDNIDLGQIFTSKSVAEYMVSLLDLSKDAKILDPCFGTGAFIKATLDYGYHSIEGFEIDKKLYDDAKKQFPSLYLQNDDFLSAETNEKYDGIIMNPPYIRQEKINDLKMLGITKNGLQKIGLYSILPRTANLYMYFIVKAIDMLKPNGELVVIFPSSWLKARNGKYFKSYIFSECSISNQVHMSGEVFEKNALVEVVILKLKKGKFSYKPTIEFKEAKNGLLMQRSKAADLTQLGFNSKFDEVASVRRGLTTGYNAMFINPKLNSNENRTYLHSIISSPKAINGYSTFNAKIDKVLIINTGQPITKELALYLKEWEDNIIDKMNPKTLYNRIGVDNYWFSLKKIDSDGILFSYFVRNDMKFVLNDAKFVARDNFYVIYPKIDRFLLLALLNNYFTYYQLEVMGKKYGAGLLKLQRYDIENLYFPNIELFTEEEISDLKRLAQKLVNEGNITLIEEMTSIIARHASEDYYSIVNIYQNEKSHRLE